MSDRPFTGADGRDMTVGEVMEMFAQLGQHLGSAERESTFEAIAEVAMKWVRGAQAVSITVLGNGKFRTVASSDERATRGDAIQYELGSGPCVDAILDRAVYHPEDLRRDDRWPEYGARVNKELGWTSMLSYRLCTDLTEHDVVAALNVYASEAAAFNSQDKDVGLLLATHSALAIAVDVHRDRANNLDRALESSREIGIAVGVLMTRHQLGREQAFDALRIASQNSNRKLVEIAVDVGDTGVLSFGAN